LREPLRLLDQLDPPASDAPAGPGLRMLDTPSRTDTVEEYAREWMRRSGSNDYSKALDAYCRGQELPPEPTSEPSQVIGADHVSGPDTVSPGVHPGSHLLEQRVRTRMRELDRGEDEYIKTLDEIMAEGA
jgi:hypothetical protein